MTISLSKVLEGPAADLLATVFCGMVRLANKQTPFASLFICLLCNQTTNQT